MKKASEAVVNEKLIQARLEYHWSQEDVAEKIGTTAVSVSRWERGITTPSSYFRAKLCQLYGKNPAELGLVQEKTKNVKEKPQSEALSKPEHLPRQLWTIPYSRSPFFTGRAGILQAIHDRFRAHTSKIVTVALSGLGGIGKTLTAIEYAYRYLGDHSAVLWANAENDQTLASDFEKMAGKRVLNLPEREEPNQELTIDAVKQWLSTHPGWLLILDNADTLTVVDPFLPRTGQGCVLLTTRDQASGDTIDDQMHIDTMEPEDAVIFLLRRARILALDASPETIDRSKREQAKAVAESLDCLPLALDQAGAYIDETKCSFSEYRALYEKQHNVLLKRRSRLAIRYRETVATTWSISFQKVARANPISADLLHLFAFLHADAIPEEVVLQGRQHLGPLIGRIDSPLVFDQALEELMKYSLVERHADNQTVRIHRLVQIVLKDEMSEQQQREWAERTVHVISQLFPQASSAPLGLGERYFLHAQVCAELITRWDMISREAAHLLHHVGTHAMIRSQNDQAQQFFQHALTIYESRGEQQSIEGAECCENAAMMYELQSKRGDAEALYRKALAIYEHLLPTDHPKLIEALNNVLLFYVKQYKLNEAQPLLERVLTASAQKTEADPITVRSMHIHGLFCLAKGECAEAERLSFQALAMHEQLRGHDHPSQISILNSIVLIYMHQGKFVEAEPLCERIVAIAEKESVPLRRVISSQLSNLATIYQRQRKFAEAEQAYHKALQAQGEMQGPDPLEVARTHNNLGLLYSRQGRYAEAEEYFQQALVTVDKNHLGEQLDVASFLTNVAVLYQKQGQWDTIEPLCQRALAIVRSLLGPDHPEMIYSLNNLAAFYTSQEKYAQAEPLYQQAVAIMEKMKGEHPLKKQLLQGYAHVMRETQREDEARAIEKRL